MSHKPLVQRRSLLLSLLLLFVMPIGMACGSGAKVAPEQPASAARAALAAPADPQPAVPAPVVVSLPPPAPKPAMLPLPWSAPPAPRADPNVLPPAVSAIAAVVVDEASGAVLFDKDAHQPLPPASLTKIATIILAL